MFDLETMSTRPDAAIVQIGACIFEEETGEITDTFLENVCLRSSMEAGLSIDAGAIEFWLGQPEEAKTFLLGDISGLQFVLDRFSAWVGSRNWARVWCHKTFDAPILDSACRVFAEPMPFHYRKIMDLRTLTRLAAIDMPERATHHGPKHDALADCRFQVDVCVRALKHLKDPDIKVDV